jgi:hypothetical protein
MDFKESICFNFYQEKKVGFQPNAHVRTGLMIKNSLKLKSIK